MLITVIGIAYLVGIFLFIRFSIVQSATTRVKRFNSRNFEHRGKPITWDNRTEISHWDDYTIRNTASHLNRVFKVKVLWVSAGSIFWPVLSLVLPLLFGIINIVKKTTNLIRGHTFKSWIAQGEEKANQRIKEMAEAEASRLELETLIANDEEIRQLNEV